MRCVYVGCWFLSLHVSFLALNRWNRWALFMLNDGGVEAWCTTTLWWKDHSFHSSQKGGKDHRRGMRGKDHNWITSIERQILLGCSTIGKKLSHMFGFSISVSCKFGKKMHGCQTTWPTVCSVDFCCEGKGGSFWSPWTRSPPNKNHGQTVVYKDDYIDIRISSKHVIFDITAICHVIQYQLRYDYYEFNQNYRHYKML